MNKIELEAKVDAIQDEINFLRAVYEAVRKGSVAFVLPPMLFLATIANSITYYTYYIRILPTTHPGTA